MNLILFFSIAVILTIMDIRNYRIPNVIIIPAIIGGCLLTRHWLWAGIMFTIGAMLFKYNKLGGGDVKVLTFAGACLGWFATICFILTHILIKLYRKMRFEIGDALPYVPFFLVASIITTATIYLVSILSRPLKGGLYV